jgi:hypothetical protein
VSPAPTRQAIPAAPALQLQQRHQPVHAEQPARRPGQPQQPAEKERLVGDVHRQGPIAGADEPGHQGGAADADEDGVTADEPGEVQGGRLRCLGRDVVAALRRIPPGEQRVVEHHREDE